MVWREFVELAERREMPFTALCARFGISRKTGYKWLNRFRARGDAGLQPQSRRPKSSPRRTPEGVIDTVLALRKAQPDWSVARIHATLAAQGVQPLPAPSTIDLILRRDREAVAAQILALGPDAQRFEPNYRWTLRLGGRCALADRMNVVPVVVRDETTGFLVGTTLQAEKDEAGLIGFVEALMQRHGLPWRMAIPRDESLRHEPAVKAHSALTVRLMRLGVVVEFIYGPAVGAGSPEAQARKRLAEKLARLPAYQRASLAERTPAADALEQFAQEAARLDGSTASGRLEQLRQQHNFGGKQEALQRRSPISLYRPSLRRMPSVVPEPDYAPTAEVRLVSEKGMFTFKRRLVHVGRVFAGMGVELKLTPHAERFVVLFAGQGLGLVDISEALADGTASLSLGVM